MRIKSKYVAAITIIATLFIGRLSVEKAILQTGTNTGYEGGSWIVGNRIPTQQSDGIRLYDISLSEEIECVENSSSPILGAGCASNVTVRPGYYYYTTEELEKGLLYDLAPLAHYLIEAQETYGIDAVFLAAVAAEESGWGRYKLRKNNIFGFENCDFNSLEHCIDYAADWIKNQYLTPGGTYYEGVSVADINKHYNGHDIWEKHIVTIMGQIIDRIERTDTE